MKFSTLMRHFREALRSIFRNGWMSFASVSAISISLFILGAFLILALNVNNVVEGIESDVEFRVHLEMNTTEEQVRTVHNEIGSIPEVSEVVFVSREEGLQQMRETFGEDSFILDGYEGDQNPLPDSFTVRVNQPEDVVPVVQRIEQLDENRANPLIFRVVFDETILETMMTITQYLRNIGLVLVAALAFTAMFLISNTIKLTIVARRREISIMKLVGATNGFIRWPFFLEGVMLGIIGSIIPIALLFIGYGYFISAQQLNLGLMMIQLLPLDDFLYIVGGLLLGIGLVIGMWGSILSVRKFLKI